MKNLQYGKFKNKTINNYQNFLNELVVKPEQGIDDIPGNAPADKQLHVFDFDDTLGVTKNGNGVILYKNGQPVHKSEQEVLDWVKKYGVSENDLLDPAWKDGTCDPKDKTSIKGIVKVPNLNAYAAFVDSNKLTNFTGNQDFKDDSKRYNTDGGTPPENIDQAIYLDYSPSSFVDNKTTTPVTPTIKKLTDIESKGVDAEILTARNISGLKKDFWGKEHNVTNNKDMGNFISGQGVKVPGTIPIETDRNKGNTILNYIKNKEPKPKEIHFYDDAEQNTDQVKAIADKIPDTELYIYGPGHFSDSGLPNPNKPSYKKK